MFNWINTINKKRDEKLLNKTNILLAQSSIQEDKTINQDHKKPYLIKINNKQVIISILGNKLSNNTKNVSEYLDVPTDLYIANNKELNIFKNKTLPLLIKHLNVLTNDGFAFNYLLKNEDLVYTQDAQQLWFKQNPITTKTKHTTLNNDFNIYVSKNDKMIKLDFDTFKKDVTTFNNIDIFKKMLDAKLYPLGIKQSNLNNNITREFITIDDNFIIDNLIYKAKQTNNDDLFTDLKLQEINYHLQKPDSHYQILDTYESKKMQLDKINNMIADYKSDYNTPDYWLKNLLDRADVVPFLDMYDTLELNKKDKNVSKNPYGDLNLQSQMFLRAIWLDNKKYIEQNFNNRYYYALSYKTNNKPNPLIDQTKLKEYRANLEQNKTGIRR